MTTSGRAPSISDYLDFARAAGCTVVHGERPAPDGTKYAFALIRHPDGAWACEIFEEPDDTLASTTVARLDRRLGVKSYFFV